MLRLIAISSPDEKKQHFHNNSSLDDLWIVSHIEAKKWLQDQLMKDAESIPTQTVLRATEYWQWLFSVNLPEWRPVSESLIYAFIEDWFIKNQTPLQLSDIEMFYNFLAQTSSVLYSQQKSLFLEWLSGDEQRLQKLLPWWKLAEDLQSTLNQKKWIGRPWILSLLSGKDDLYFGEQQKIYFDLGLDLQHDEVEMILRLSQDKDVIVFVPQPTWLKEYAHALSTYERLLQAAQLSEVNPQEISVKVQTVAESSVLKEVKNVVGRVRQLLAQGILPSQIAICSPVIEDYWPLLRAHLDVEGVPAYKRIVVRAISLPDVQKWLSRLQSLKEEFSEAHLQAMMYFSETEDHKIPFAEFKKNFFNNYDAKQMREFFTLPKAQKKPLVLADFIDLLFTQWLQADDALINEIADRLMKDMSLDDEMSYDIWLKYLELVLSRYEIPIYREDPKGIHILSLDAADWTECDHLFVLGCEQKHLFEIQKSPLSMTDVFAIQRDLGFYLPKPESQKSEFNLRWILQRETLQSTLLHSESDFLGDPQLASHFWLKENLAGHGEVQNIHSTRWDEVIRFNLQSQDKQPAFSKKLSKEFSLDGYDDIQLKQMPKLSASQLQKFDECGFKFFVERILKLSPQETYDLEIDPMYNGQILHRVLEVLLQKYPSLNVDKNALDVIYETVMQEMAAKFPLQKFWLNEKSRQLAFIQNFISLEMDYRKSHPQTQTAGLEVPLSGYITSEAQQIMLTPEPLSEKSFLFSGKIDRVDRDTLGRYAIIDYKTSKSAGLKAFSSWLTNSQFQMTLYAQAVESGLAESIPPAPVKAAEYIFLKDKKRGSGYILETEENGFIGLETKVKTVSAEKKLEHDEQFSALISQHLAAIQKGVFRPQPKDVKICETCHWSSTCRAPHLR